MNKFETSQILKIKKIKQVTSKQRITITSTIIKPCALSEICRKFTASFGQM